MKLTRFLDRIFISQYTKTSILFSSVLLLFLILKNWVNKKIVSHLTVEANTFDNITFYACGALFSVALIFIIYKIVIKLYDPSSLIKKSAVLLTLIYILIRFTDYKNGWFFTNFGVTGIKYIDLVGILFICFLLSLLGTALWRKYGIPETDYSTNPFTADDPILSLDEDQLAYGERAKSIIELLRQSNFKKSFTIGIVGPWGNGKSSLIELMERRLEEEPLHETLHLKFLPYLNHSETEIISEFFSQLSGEISKHNGQLADYIVDYSDRLLKLYKNKSIKDFLTKQIPGSGTNDTSIDTYLRINTALKKVNKKFIVFIDDLDRLSSKEVLQVLKLVRNTANFRNFIFIVALDKDYVLNTLVSNNDISDHSFVDKFFQLEVYLPEIDKLQLKGDFLLQLKSSGLQGKTEFIQSVEKAIYQTNNLFNDYIFNHRGAKRLVNQLVFDYEMLPDELDTNDFLNFTYLKMSFPSAIKFLNSNWQEILPYNSESKLRELQESEENNDGNPGDIMRMVRNTRIFSANSRFNPKLKDYKITSDIETTQTFSQHSALSKHQNELLGKTFIALFGKENQNPKHTSIKFGNNLRKLLQQKITSDDLSNAQFQNIVREENSFNNIQNVISTGRVQNVLDRIIFYTPENISEEKNIIELILYIFNKAEAYGTYSIHVLQILSDFIKTITSNKSDAVETFDLWEHIQTRFLDIADYESFKKLEFLAFLSENRFRLDFAEWGVKEEDLKKLSLQIFKSFLGGKNDNLWDVSDYTFYHAYHKANKLHPVATLNPLVIDFWKTNDVKLLCVQLTENDAWTIKMLKTSDHAATVFGSKTKYLEFVEKQLEGTEDEALLEYLDFIRLESYANFSTYLRYEFIIFDEIKQKLEKVKTSNRLSRDEFSNVVEIFVQSFEEPIYNATFTNVSVNSFPTLLSNHYYNVNGNWYTKVMLNTEDIHTTIPALLNHYQNIVANSEEYKVLFNENEKHILRNEEKVLEIISIQPVDFAN